MCGDGVLDRERMEAAFLLAQREVARPGVDHVEPHERVVFLEDLTVAAGAEQGHVTS
jgi:hypothetical protein